MEKQQAEKARASVAESVPGVDPEEVEVFEDWVSSVRTHVAAFEVGMAHEEALRGILAAKEKSGAEFVQITATDSQRLRVAIY